MTPIGLARINDRISRRSQTRGEAAIFGYMSKTRSSSTLYRLIEAGQLTHKVLLTPLLPIWDMCHYGYPDDLDPFSDAFVERFSEDQLDEWSATSLCDCLNKGRGYPFCAVGPIVLRSDPGSASSLTATSRSSRRSNARWTVDMPP